MMLLASDVGVAAASVVWSAPADSASVCGGGKGGGGDRVGGGDASTQSSNTFVFLLEPIQVQVPPEDELHDHEWPFL